MSQAQARKDYRLGLRAGDWVVVKSREEILATLDERARLDDLPFQPEMLAFCGRRMRVAKVAHKTCDNIHKTKGRRMVNAVHLEGARCDGGGPRRLPGRLRLLLEGGLAPEGGGASRS